MLLITLRFVRLQGHYWDLLVLKFWTRLCRSYDTWCCWNGQHYAWHCWDFNRFCMCVPFSPWRCICSPTLTPCGFYPCTTEPITPPLITLREFKTTLWENPQMKVALLECLKSLNNHLTIIELSWCWHKHGLMNLPLWIWTAQNIANGMDWRSKNAPRGLMHL